MSHQARRKASRFRAGGAAGTRGGRCAFAPMLGLRPGSAVDDEKRLSAGRTR
ncbi:hypothetical protein ACFFX0_30425 [Citricoccus parietis]|uniref:Uncharacterized protein n=1 Tax=Citricoccus parietis TaxID=592307 RepID=A0ABV5G8I0_9MICC